MKLHEDAETFKDAIRATAEFKSLRELYVEKDYWVTYALHAIFHSPLKDVAIFKGGTSLSKCYQVIHRFSEDIDIVVLQDEELSNSKMDQRVKEVSKIVNKTTLEETDVKGITRKRGNFRKVAYEYDKIGDRQAFGQVRDKIIVEVTRLGHFEPHEERQVSSYIHEMMKANGQKSLISRYGLEPFKLNVLRIERTFCEKIMSLVRFSYAEDPYQALKDKIRHVYDIHMLLKSPLIHEFFDTPELDEMLVKVGKDDMKGYKGKYEWLKYHPASALIFDKPQETWIKIRSEYNSRFKDLVIRDFPSEDEVLSDLKEVSTRIEKIEWPVGEE